MRDSKRSPHNLCSTSSEREVVKRARRRSTEERNLNERGLRFPDLKLLVEQVPIGSIQAYARRLRKPSKTQHQALQDSVRAFGLVFPFLVDRNNVLIGGHAVFEAAKALGLQTVPVVRASHLDEPEVKTLRLALNRLAELSTWDEVALAIEFKELFDLDLTLDLSFDLAITGFSHPEIDRLTSVEGNAHEADDEVPEAEEAALVSRVGDLWLLRSHRLICGDARDPGVYERLMAGEFAAMGIHDAPYNVSIENHVSKSGRHGDFVMGVGELSKPEFTAFLTTFLAHARAFSAPGATQFAFMDWRHSPEMLQAGAQAELEQKNLCVWNKGTGAMGSFYRSQHELVFVFRDRRAQGINNVQFGRFGRNRTNVWDYPGAAGLRRELELHPTPKPVSLVADAIRDCSNRGDIVLDCFSGSGTTIIAAARTGRRGYAVELDPRYVDVAIRRFEQWSGETARHAETGLTFAEIAEQRKAELGQPEPLDAVNDSALTARSAVSDADTPPVRVRRRAA
jgi:DNA methylase/ParB-like nuclease family protein